jgi:hypothetical protein
MLELSLRTHPDVIFAYSQNFVNMVIRVENHGAEVAWCEADVKVPNNLSLSPTSELKKGRVRIGVLSKKEFIEKSIRIFANSYTPPQIYQTEVTLYAFNKDGVIQTRMEKKTEIRCEVKKEEVL